jgi:acyl carrier protein
MDSVDVKDKLLLFFQNNFYYGEAADEINADESLIGNGYIDSVGIIGLVSFIEKDFNIEVYDHEIIPENFDSLNNIFVYVSNKVEKVNSPNRKKNL